MSEELPLKTGDPQVRDMRVVREIIGVTVAAADVEGPVQKHKVAGGVNVSVDDNDPPQRAVFEDMAV